MNFGNCKSKSHSRKSQVQVLGPQVQVQVRVLGLQVRVQVQVTKNWTRVGLESKYLTRVLQHWSTLKCKNSGKNAPSQINLKKLESLINDPRPRLKMPSSCTPKFMRESTNQHRNASRRLLLRLRRLYSMLRELNYGFMIIKVDNELFNKIYHKPISKV
jgi:hypothetical protein